MRDLTFLDLAVLEKLEGESTLESFGGHIYSSFFDTAAIMGQLQVKGLVSINSEIGHSVAKRTQLGNQVLLKAVERGNDEIDELDHAVLKIIAGGAREHEHIAHELNIRSEDLAYHLFRLVKQGYLDYNIRNGKLSLAMSEKGFKLTGFVPRKHFQNVEKPKEEPKHPAKLVGGSLGHGHKGLEAAMADTAADITQRIPTGAGKTVKLTKFNRFIAKAVHMMKNNFTLILLAVAAVVVIAIYSGYVRI